MEIETARVVLDHSDPPRGSSSPPDLVCSLDHEMGSCIPDCASRHRGFVRDALDPFDCWEIHRETEALLDD